MARVTVVVGADAVPLTEVVTTLPAAPVIVDVMRSMSSGRSSGWSALAMAAGLAC